MQVAKIIAFCFGHYEDIVKAVAEKRLDPGTPKTGGSHGHCRISDPTAMLGIRHLSEVESVEIEYGAAYNGKRATYILDLPERWIKVVKYTREYYGGQLQWELIELHFVQGLEREEVWKRMKIGKTLYHVLYNNVFSYAAGVAKGLGIPPRKK